MWHLKSSLQHRFSLVSYCFPPIFFDWASRNATRRQVKIFTAGLFLFTLISIPSFLLVERFFTQLWWSEPLTTVHSRVELLVKSFVLTDLTSVHLYWSRWKLVGGPKLEVTVGTLFHGCDDCDDRTVGIKCCLDQCLASCFSLLYLSLGIFSVGLLGGLTDE